MLHTRLFSAQVETGESLPLVSVSVLGLYQAHASDSPAAGQSGAGRIALYGDSNCLDNSHMEKGESFTFLFAHDFGLKRF